MGQLHEVLAVEKELENAYKSNEAELIKLFGKPALFFGFHKKLEMLVEGDQSDFEPETQAITYTAKDKLSEFHDVTARYLNAVCQKEMANQEAKADIEVDGAVIAKDVPATFLLGLESKLIAIRNVYKSLPTLPDGTTWEPDPNKGENIFRMSPDEVTYKTKKAIKHKVLYEATPNHPAQIEKWSEDERVGKYTKQMWCGLFSNPQKTAILNRVDKLIRAVKKARQRANRVEVKNTEVMTDILSYLQG